jgi:hypothetical protein
MAPMGATGFSRRRQTGNDVALHQRRGAPESGYFREAQARWIRPQASSSTESAVA